MPRDKISGAGDKKIGAAGNIKGKIIFGVRYLLQNLYHSLIIIRLDYHKLRNRIRSLAQKPAVRVTAAPQSLFGVVAAYVNYAVVLFAYRRNNIIKVIKVEKFDQYFLRCAYIFSFILIFAFIPCIIIIPKLIIRENCFTKQNSIYFLYKTHKVQMAVSCWRFWLTKRIS